MGWCTAPNLSDLPFLSCPPIADELEALKEWHESVMNERDESDAEILRLWEAHTAKEEEVAAGTPLDVTRHSSEFELSNAGLKVGCRTAPNLSNPPSLSCSLVADVRQQLEKVMAQREEREAQIRTLSAALDAANQQLAASPGTPLDRCTAYFGH